MGGLVETVETVETVEGWEWGLGGRKVWKSLTRSG